MNLYLIGFMGAGKSTVADALSKALNSAHIDVDSMVVDKAKMTINDIFEQHGETFFRDLETEAMKGIDPTQDLIVATGGGCVERPENLKMMKESGVTIYLQANWDEIVERLSASSHRPLANADNDWSETRSRYLHRLPLYETADITVNTSGKSPTEIANEVIVRLGL